MPKHQPPFLRLVVSNSLSDKGTSSSRARCKRGKCHLPGIEPRRSHCHSALAPMPKRDCKTPSSNRPRISPTDVPIADNMGNKMSGCQEQKVLSEKNFKFQALVQGGKESDALSMPNDPAIKQAWDKSVVERLAGLLDDMGWTEKQFAKHVHGKLGITQKAVEQYFSRGSMPAYSIFYTALFLGVDVAYLMQGGDGAPEKYNPTGKYAYKKKIRGQAAEIAALRKAARKKPA